MSFHLIDGNDLEKMAEKFAELLLSGGDPFDEDVVVTTDNAVRRWLAVKVAEKKGFFPSVEWMRPGDFIYKYLFNPALERPQGFDISGFEPEVTVWSIYKALGEIKSERVDNYVAKSALKRWQLASRLASLFDKYMTYRQDWLEKWEAGNTVGLGPDEAWQAEIWRKIAGGQDDTFSKLCTKFIEFKEPNVKIRPTKKRFFYFGIALLPKVHLKAAMLKFSKVADVWFFMTNPCKKYWGDAATKRTRIKQELEEGLPWDGNQLLGELGQAGGVLFNDLYDIDENLSPTESYFTDINCGSLLGKVRLDIQECSEISIVKEPFKIKDSILVHACRSPLREVEVLKDRLFLAFKELKDLKPGDVRVYVTDMETYAPFIEAVFGDGKIPFRINARGLAGKYQEVSVFARILDILQSRFRASEIADIMSSRPVLERFGLEACDANKIAELITSANAAWGRDAAHKDSAGGAKAYRHSWDFVIDRLVLGVAAADFSAADEARVGASDPARKCVPEGRAEGSAHLVGVLSKTVALLAEAAENVKTDRTAGEWYSFLKRLRDAFVPAAGTDGVMELDRMISSLVEFVEKAGMSDTTLPYTIVRSWFAANTKEQSSSSNPVSGSVTFTTFPTSGLALPARVVGMPGMNDGAFPSRDRKTGYDLLLKKPDKGDPSNRRRGRYAFLQAVMSASDRLVITYSAHAQKDGAEIPPSIVVRELLDSVGGYFEKPSDEKTERWRPLVVEHPLHPFGRKYFESASDSRLVTFDSAQEKIAEEIRKKKGEIPDEPDIGDWTIDWADGMPGMELDADAMIGILKDPRKYFLEHIVGAASKPREEKSPADDEPVEFENALYEYIFHQDLIESVLYAGDVVNADAATRLATMEKMFNAKHDAGVVPSGVKWNDLKGAYARLFEAIPQAPLPDNVKIIVHASNGLNGSGVVMALVRHLARLKANPSSVTWIVSRPRDEKDKDFALKFTPPESETFADEALEKLRELLCGIQSAPLAFDAKLFWNVAKKNLLEGKKPDGSKYEEKWISKAHSTDGHGGFSDEVKEMFGKSIDDPAGFKEISNALAEIFLACHKTEAKGKKS